MAATNVLSVPMLITLPVIIILRVKRNQISGSITEQKYMCWIIIIYMIIIIKLLLLLL